MRDIMDLIKIGAVVIFSIFIYSHLFGFGSKVTEITKQSTIDSVRELQKNYDDCSKENNKCSTELTELKSLEPYVTLKELETKNRNKPTWLMVIVYIVGGVILTIEFVYWVYPIPKKNGKIQELEIKIGDLEKNNLVFSEINVQLNESIKRKDKIIQRLKKRKR